MIVKISLPWPDGHLSPNQLKRGWYRQKIPYVKAAREFAFLTARDERWRGLLSPSDELKMTIIAHAPQKSHEWNWDNMATGCKAYQDGICQALGLDDRQIREGRVILAEVIPGGQVEMILERRDVAVDQA